MINECGRETIEKKGINTHFLWIHNSPQRKSMQCLNCVPWTILLFCQSTGISCVLGFSKSEYTFCYKCYFVNGQEFSSAVGFPALTLVLWCPGNDRAVGECRGRGLAPNWECSLSIPGTHTGSSCLLGVLRQFLRVPTLAVASALSVLPDTFHSKCIAIT